MVGDVKAVLQDLYEILKNEFKPKKPSGWVEDLQKTKREWNEALEKYRSISGSPINQGRVVRELRDVLPDNSSVVTDIGNHAKWIAQQFEARMPGATVASMGFAAMGFGVAAAPGVKLGKPNDPVVCVCGDGCFSMIGPQSLSVAVEYNIPVVYCIFNDFRLAPIVYNQKTFYNERYLMSEFMIEGTGELFNPDFVKLGESYNIGGELVDTAEKFLPAMERALATGKPYILDVRVDKQARWIPGGGSRIIRFAKEKENEDAMFR
jgi:acetolactate synthase-1/2/3 large subunit